MSDHRLAGSADLTKAQALIAEANANADTDKDTAKQQLNEAIRLLDDCINGAYIAEPLKQQARGQKEIALKKLNSIA
jgi:uncharacterized membrane-anchored protein